MAPTNRTEVFVDSGAWIALTLHSDPLHPAAAAAYSQRLVSCRLVTSSDVYDESMTRVRYDGGLAAARLLQKRLSEAEKAGRLTIVWIDSRIYDSAATVMEQHPGLKLSFTDATSAVIARARAIRSIFGFDADFRGLGFELIPG